MTAGQSQSTKNNGFKLLADKLKKQSKGRMCLTTRQMGERFRTFKLNYIKANKFSRSTGAGVTESDLEKGINTLEEKLDEICPYYQKMDKLFGHMPNVQPLCQQDTQDTDDDGSVNKAQGGFQDLADFPSVSSNLSCVFQISLI